VSDRQALYSYSGGSAQLPNRSARATRVARPIEGTTPRWPNRITRSRSGSGNSRRSRGRTQRNRRARPIVARPPSRKTSRHRARRTSHRRIEVRRDVLIVVRLPPPTRAWRFMQADRGNPACPTFYTVPEEAHRCHTTVPCRVEPKRAVMLARQGIPRNQPERLGRSGWLEACRMDADEDGNRFHLRSSVALKTSH